MKKVELLAPAGDLDKLKTAIDYGADAVYMAGSDYGLRTASKNFTADDMREACDYAHKRGKRIYITMNILAHNEDLEGIEDYIQSLIDLKVDALIVSDPGIYSIIRSVNKDVEVHMSTQASVTNYRTVKYWMDQGIKRIVLARELSLKEIQEIKKNIPDSELECFVHGAMCMSYSGRCLLSNYMTGRDANRGDCAQACRWKYRLVEEKRPGEYFPIEENEKGTFIFNSKDLCMIEHLDKLINSGIDSLKIEGRVKSQYYVATVVRSYRIAIDKYYNDEFDDKTAKRLLDEIKKVSYRDFTTGFFEKKPDENDQLYESSSYIREYDFVGMLLDYDEDSKIATFEQRNRVFAGDEVEIFGPEDGFITIKIEKIYDENMNEIEVANKAKQIFKIRIDEKLQANSMMRKKSDN
ncbi:U32 family peptidase [uncultured Finegoldia sp.]|uniref:peptidase U32 family protein n=1 Tax=uncultured Finegoldia sp. TaxID=328009 RepID=UPI002604F80B|nr:U32 family peptidase [uncultured Finegoldia sp.]